MLTWIGWLALALFVMFALSWRSKAKKGLILGLLIKQGEMTGLQLRKAGVGGLVYSYLFQLEEEGLVERRSEGPVPERGGLPRYHYRIKAAPYVVRHLVG